MHDRETKIQLILQALKGGHSEPSAADAAGIDYVTLWRWKRDVPGFAAQIDEAKRSRIPLLEDALFRKGLKGDVPAIKLFLEKHDKGWRDRLKDEAGNTVITPVYTYPALARKSPAELIAMLSPEARERLRRTVKMLIAIGQIPDRADFEVMKRIIYMATKPLPAQPDTLPAQEPDPPPTDTLQHGDTGMIESK